MTVIWTDLTVRFAEHQNSQLSNKCTNRYVIPQHDAQSAHNVLQTFPEHSIVGKIRKIVSSDVTSYSKGKEASHSPLRKSKNFKISRHPTIYNCPLPVKLKRVSPSLGNWSVRQSSRWRPAVTEVLQIVLSSLCKMLRRRSKLCHAFTHKPTIPHYTVCTAGSAVTQNTNKPIHKYS